MATSPNINATHLDADISTPHVVLNASLDLTDESINGLLIKNFTSDDDYTLSVSSNPKEWQYGSINLTDTGAVLSSGRNVIVPTNKRVYRIKNSTAQTLTIKTSGGSGVAVNSSENKLIQCDGSDVVDYSPNASDVAAIHVNASGEISSLTSATPASGDYVLIEDVSDSNSKKKVTVGSLTGSVPTESLIIPVSDETTLVSTGTSVVTFRMPYAFTLSEVRSSLTTAGSTSGTTTVDINESGTSILSTKLTIDAGEKTSTTAASTAVISDSSIADDAEITIDIDSVSAGATETGLKVVLIGTKS